MSALAMLFPNATPRPWSTADVIESGPDIALVVHAVNTYDAREALLREALAGLKETTEQIAEEDWPEGFALEKRIEDALAEGTK